ncbi:MAG: hypothetical protein Q8P81_02315 [Nanoarchaeota archaeon]|nr:hypothetical protein [Nanoarchaeota archaeon]
MKIYVAGKFEKKDLIHEVYRRIEELGHEVSYDWTTHKPIKPYPQNSDIAAQYSDNELEGIAKCDVFIYLTDENGTTLPMEFGAALGLAKTRNRPLVYAVGEFNDRSPWFFNRLVRRKDSLDDVVEELSKM